jgi:predicted outer membrane repeat protein
VAIERRRTSLPDVRELQRRIDRAAPGEAIELGEGVIGGGLVIDKPLVLRGRGAGITVIDGRELEPAVAIDAEGPVRLERLSLVRGRGSFGGGVSVDNGGRVEIEACLLEKNVARNGRGGAVAVDRGQLLISECSVIGNQAFQGGAIFAGGEARVEVAASVVSDNLAVLGGAIAAVDGAEVELWTSRFEHNRAQDRGHHLFMYATRTRQSRAVVSNSFLGAGAGAGLPISNHPHFRASLVLDNSMIDRGRMPKPVIA